MSHSTWWLVVDALCVYRLTVLFVQDEITRPLRNWASRNLNDWLNYLITCPWCMSVWVAAGVVALTALVPDAWQYPAALLAFSGVTGFLAERTNH